MSLLRITQGKIQDFTTLGQKIQYVLKVDAADPAVGAIGLNPYLSYKLIREEMLYTHQAYYVPRINLAMHWFLSFDADVKISPQQAIQIAKEVAAFHYGHQHLFGMDITENGNPHVHCLTNTLSSLDGSYIRRSREDLAAWLEYANVIFVRHGLNPINIRQTVEIHEDLLEYAER